MRLVIDQSDLHAALQVAIRGVATRSTLPVLSGILLVAEPEQLRLVATDMEMTVEVLAPARVQEEGSVVLPGRHLVEIVRRLPPGEVHLEVEGFRARILQERSRFTIHGTDPGIFPAMPHISAGSTVLFDNGLLRNVLRRTTFAVSTDEGRPILTGVSFRAEGDRLQAVATDGFRIAACSVTLERPVEGQPVAAVIPGRSLAEVARLLPDQGIGRLLLDETQAGFQLGEVRLITRLVDGVYPDVLGLVPSEYPTRVQLPTRAFQEACERAALLADTRQPARWVIRLAVEPGRLVITASDPELGEAREEIPAQVDGEGMVIGFNARYLVDGLKAIDTEEVLFELTEPLKASRLRGVGADDFTYIVLPVKIS
ncbi:DNA polymerase III, beta subunit [Thermaerobacter marianensis DSM 12885]|uniref:Beta sliding clamp n=1 Tax=Thermaerobacter marianensis (strain ATCC 700841 / DSM 12885 / JCM 10246 / 7p75a) TaxID=644966 RepID=E6SK03_THEM7|nr:DNA polymerase III subunit beta [Thermaerobacter marianensis]ADU50127.1 DNA polymerase III, beta subunit [Thermaerobacter marianensis DSM 12885]